MSKLLQLSVTPADNGWVVVIAEEVGTEGEEEDSSADDYLVKQSNRLPPGANILGLFGQPQTRQVTFVASCEEELAEILRTNLLKGAEFDDE